MKRFQRILAVFLVVCTLFLACALPAFADDPEELYDVTTSSVMDDLQYLFDPPIDTSVYSTRAKQAGAADYIDIVAFYSDAVFADWQGPSGIALPYESGSDYIYIYHSLGKTIAHDGSDLTFYSQSNGFSRSLSLQVVSQSEFFTKFKLLSSYRDFSELNSAALPIYRISLKFADNSRKNYDFKDFSVDLTYTNQTDFKVSKAEFSGVQKLDLDIGYTYWRAANFSEKGDGWHYQVDSIYFSIPKSIQDRLVDVELSYQQATTNPIVVTKTGEAVSSRFQEIALDSSNILIPSDLSSRYIDDDYPAFAFGFNPGWYRPTYDFSYNFNEWLDFSSTSKIPSIYWAFDVQDPSVISSGDLNSGELSDPRSTVSAHRLEEWMLNYPLTGVTTTYTAANREGTGTQQVNGILFSEVQERTTKRASDLIGTTLPTYGDTHNFFQNLSTVGFAYAWAYLTGAARIDENGNEIPIDQITSVIHELNNIGDILGKSDQIHFAESDSSKLRSVLSASKKNGEKLYLVNFNVSDYYSHSFDLSNYQGNSFEGYLAIQDVYLDMQVLRLYFENGIGEVYPLDVTSNHINGIADVTPAPEEEQLEEYAREALGWNSWWEDLLAFIKKIFAVIVIILVVLLVIRIVFWFIQLKAQKKMLKSSLPPPERSQDPPPKRRRRRRSDCRYDRRYSRRRRR